STLTTALLFAPLDVSGCPTTPEKKAKKALNAFVGFRCYYLLIPAFKPWPMKKLSNPIGVMWDKDPNKPLWSLLAKAWSIIRDQIGKEKAPLHQFFRIICPHLSMPPPETYLERRGWEFVINADGAPGLIRDPTLTSESLDDGVAATALSIEDIISYCQSMGYAQEYIFDTNLSLSIFIGVNPPTGTTMNTAGSIVHDGRVDARNKRREKRRTMRDTAFASTLKLQIADAHGGVRNDSPRGGPFGPAVRRQCVLQ
ncbi:hypothetical protein CC78DRAFT_589508, partial [Lojkania enalia]